jgi:hypothetical protein
MDTLLGKHVFVLTRKVEQSAQNSQFVSNGSVLDTHLGPLAAAKKRFVSSLVDVIKQILSRDIRE